MARFGEGDKRWIVEDRADGTNVHNWHWVERDCFDWTKKTFNDLLENVTVLNGEGNIWIKTTKVERIDGEAYVNIRKGKIIPGYEISITINWQGEAKNSEGEVLSKVDGRLEFPNIAVEYSDEDPEMKITVNNDGGGQYGAMFRQVFMAKGKDMFVSKVREYFNLMAQGGPFKNEILQKSNGAKFNVAKVNCNGIQ